MGEFANQLRRQYAPVPFLIGKITGLAERVFMPGERGLHARELVPKIRERGEAFEALPDDKLRAEFQALRRLPADSRERIVDAFAITREAIRRRLGVRLYDVQIMGGLAMVRGKIAEMATGEGKTLTVVPAAAYFGLDGAGVHVATVNSYLAERDHEETRPVFDLLGLESALLPERASPELKRKAYLADITYGVGHEFGFDYLRDQTALHSMGGDEPGRRFVSDLLGRRAGAGPVAQRPLAVALVDEADSILIDEALTPLLLSGSKGKADPDAARACQFAAQAIRHLTEGEDFELDAKARHVRLLPRLEERLLAGEAALSPKANGIPPAALRRAWPGYLRNALTAEHFFQRDVHYIIGDGKIILVDESTGRAFPDRTWKDGLHQAVEAKEGLDITDEGVSMASISRQRFYRLYPKLAGMTGTAMESAGELWQSYRLRVEPIPLNRPSRLRILPQRTFRTAEEKFAAILAEILDCHARGQPVLAGTRDIRKSELLAAMLEEAGIPFRLLNARQDKEEADIISKAGRLGAVTIATNMAGRGAHIPLAPGVPETGGLHVVCSERHESVRIDRQLLGRAARQGQPGSGRCFCAMDDELAEKFGGSFPALKLLLERAQPGPGGELPQAAGQRFFDKLQQASEAALYRRRRMILHQQEWNEETRGRM